MAKFGANDMRVSIALIASLVATQPIVAFGAQPNTDWAKASSLSEYNSEIRNTVQLQGSSLKWNREEISESELKTLLRILAKDISPQPLLVLSYDDQASSGQVARIKSIIDEQLDCNPSLCLEITSASN